MKQCVSVPKQCVGGVCDRCRMEKNEKDKQMNTQDPLQKQLAEAWSDLIQAEIKMRTLENENNKLRKALHSIVEAENGYIGNDYRLAKIARSALELEDRIKEIF